MILLDFFDSPINCLLYTSSGTGSEVTPFAVITDDRTGTKYPLADYELLPNMAIIDADNMMNQPKGCLLYTSCGYNAISAILRGYGDSKSPLLFVAISGCLNLAGDIVLVKYLDMGVSGTALATIASQGISMFLAMFYLNRRNFCLLYTSRCV